MTMFNILPTATSTPQPVSGLGDNLFLDFLEEEPRVAFNAIAPTSTGSPASQRFFQNQFQTIHDRFLGQLGQQILGGQDPTARFVPFLQKFDFNQFAAATPPWLRGVQNQRFQPNTRFLFQF